MNGVFSGCIHMIIPFGMKSAIIIVIASGIISEPILHTEYLYDIFETFVVDGGRHLKTHANTGSVFKEE